MILRKPSEDLLESYRSAVVESYENDVDEWKPFELENYESWSNKIIGMLEYVQEGEDLPEGIYMTHTFWCTDEDEFVGEVQIRPELSEEIGLRYGHISYAIRYSRWGQGYGTRILKLALEETRKLGLEEVYIVCHSSNIGSVRVIEKNGGIFVRNDDRDGSSVFSLKL